MENDFYLTLIYKKLAESITTAENEQLEAWLAVSEGNRDEAGAVEAAWHASANLTSVPDVDLDEAFGGLDARILAEEAALPSPDLGTEEPQFGFAPKRSAAFNWRRWAAVAASVAVLAVVGILAWPLLQGNVVTEWVAVSSGDEQQSVSLEDGSVVTLAPQSTLHYPKTALASARQVKLEGKAFFKVTKNAKRPFTIETAHDEITVLGTSFSVEESTDRQEVRVHVQSGKVRMASLQSGADLILKAGERGTHNSSLSTLTKESNVSANELARYSRKLVFVDSPVSEVVSGIEQLYAIDLQFEDTALMPCPFTFTFDQMSQKDVLTTLSTVLGSKVEATGNTFRFIGGTCD